MNLTYLLRTCKLFSDLNRHDLEAVEQIAISKEYRKGGIIFREGEPSRGFFLVVAGAAKIFRTGPDGRERVFHVVESGDAFAEAAMFMDTYPAMAEALVSPTTVIQVDKNGFKQLIARDPRLSFKIIGTMVNWLRQMRDALTDLTLKEVPARLASYALSLPAEPGKPIKVNVSKTTIAQMIGTTKETFSRVLNRFAQHRILTFRGTQLRILNRARLEKIAGGEEKI
ncbi:MAG: Crp/Fnr family transcriptional regulator [Verrucomicrobia bacterium]|nr:Crp/Fnr family transcriptional regulator [Verrucomicrobiota bacterium]